MLSRLKQYFVKKSEVQNYSTTLTPATEGTSSKKGLSPDIANILRESSAKHHINSEDFNKIIDFYFNVKPISNSLYVPNKSMFSGMCFEIEDVESTYNKEGDLTNLHLVLREKSLGNDITMKISVKDFHEVFNLLKVKSLNLKKGSSC